MNLPPETNTKTFSWIDRFDWVTAFALAFVTFAALAIQLTAPGVTWDEGAPNFPAAKNQAQWISSLFQLESPFSKGTIDQYWYTSSDHPSLPRTYAAVSHLLFSGLMDEVAALRIPSAFQFSLLAASLFLFLRVQLPRLPALAGGLALVFMPRMFGEAHIFSLDVPITCWWFWTAASAYLVFHGRLNPFWFGLCYAVTFTTKLHSVFLPLPLLAWAFIQIYAQDNRKIYLHRLGSAIMWAVVLLPIIYIGLQPWLWHDTWQRVSERFFDYAEKTTARPIPLYYFGKRFLNDTPWHYPLVMVTLTVPLTILLSSLLGLFSPLFDKERTGIKNILIKSDVLLFLFLLFVTPLSIVLLPLAQAYDGCRLFLPCFPFLAALCGFGVNAIAHWMQRFLKAVHTSVVMIALIVLPSLFSFYHVHPFYLAYYNVLIGGVSGAHEAGFETTYWCDGLTKEMLEKINTIIPPDKSLKPMSMSYDVIDYYKERGWLRPDIEHRMEYPPPYDYYLLQCRQGMFTVIPGDIDEWELYLDRNPDYKPLAKTEVNGVPLFVLYGRLD